MFSIQGAYEHAHTYAIHSTVQISLMTTCLHRSIGKHEYHTDKRHSFACAQSPNTAKRMLTDLNDGVCHARQFFLMPYEVSLQLNDLFVDVQNGKESCGDS